MPIDGDLIRRACKGASVETARYLCREQLDQFRKAVSSGNPLTVACTQEAPLFSEIAGGDTAISFVNIRETGGWSDDAAKTGPKMAALLAAATEPLPEIPFVSLASEGVVLVYGRDEKAIEAANLLKDHLDVTVLITKTENLAPPRVTEFPIVKGTIKSATGYLGAFEIVVDDYATPSPSSRDTFAFPAPRNGAVSRCDLVLDLSGNPALFSAADLRDGYLRADPGDPAAILRAVLRARELVGTFDKPRYITFSENLCAHSRSKIIGCSRCLGLCPTGAITPAGDHVAIDPQICAGCGQCAAVCPTGAAAYALPPADALMRKLRVMLLTYREAGGSLPIVLLHDESHGVELIDVLARHGTGLPANVLPLAVNEITQIGLETIAAAFAFGASGVRLLLRARPKHDIEGLKKTLALAEPILAGLGFGVGNTTTIETDDPDTLGSVLRAIMLQAPTQRPASFAPVGGKRDVLRQALRELHVAAPTPVDVIPLPAGAPFGTVEVNVEGCTLCLSCVSACPTGALRDDPERPTLRFEEDACVQCGLCKATCPEKVITLKPQIDFRATTASARLIKQEEPFPCVRCGKPFGVKSTVERVVAKLEGKHWMYKGSAQRLEVIKMCEDCRVAVMTETDFDPYGIPRSNPRTTDDYLREREKLKEEFERKRDS
ncbi:MAG: 4Fe-4S binding protein [Xanthobacteraceae bacterium]